MKHVEKVNIGSGLVLVCPRMGTFKFGLYVNRVLIKYTYNYNCERYQMCENRKCIEKGY